MSPFLQQSLLPLFPPELCRLQIRWMVRRDISAVVAIEEKNFEFPWQEEDFLQCLRQRNCVGMVAERHGSIVGFVMYETFKNRLHVLNMAVHPECRRLGIGKQLLAKLQSKLSPQRRAKMTLEVRETNLAAQLFFRAHGFRAVAILKNFYENSQDDAYLMQYRLPRVRTKDKQHNRKLRQAG